MAKIWPHVDDNVGWES